MTTAIASRPLAIVLCVVALAALTVALPHAQAPQAKPDVALKAAIDKEVVDGDLKAAIELYRKLADGADRAVAAQALARMGQCYEKLGTAQNAEARKAYERLVRDFADQKTVVDQARMRLTALGPAARATRGSMASRALWNPPRDAVIGAVSPDGRFIGYVDWSAKQGNSGVVVLHDLQTGTNRRLTNLEDAAIEGLAFSRDGTRLAYNWFVNATRRTELRVVSLAGSGMPAPQRVLASEDVRWIQPHDWTPDSKWIAVAVSRGNNSFEIALVSAADGSTRVLKSGLQGNPAHIALSPDGRYLAFETAGPGTRARDIGIMATDGGREIPGIVHRADDALVGWSPDGSLLVFASDRTGSRGLWAQQFIGGSLAQSPAPIRSDVGSARYFGFGLAGELYSLMVGFEASSEVRVGTLDTATGAWFKPPTDALAEYLPGLDRAPAYQPSPDWSADGRQFSLHAKDPRGTALSSATILVGLPDTKSVRSVSAQLAWMQGIVLWTPDGSAFIGGGGNQRGMGIWRVDAKTGATTELARGGDDGHTISYLLGMSSDGSRIRFTRLPGSSDGPVVIEKDLASGKERQLAGSLDEFAGVSPDGERLYVLRASPARGPSSPRESVLVEHDFASGRERALATRSFVAGTYLRLSPDGALIAAVVNDGPASSESLVLIPVAGGAPREVMRTSVPPSTAGQSVTQAPKLELFWGGWSPDSQSLLVNLRSGGPTAPELWWVSADGRSPRRLDIGGSGQVIYLRWHPDGKQVALVVRETTTESRPSEMWVLENVLPVKK